MATSLVPQQQEQQQQQSFTNRRITCRNPQWTYLKLELYFLKIFPFSIIMLFLTSLYRINHPLLLLDTKNEKNRLLDPLTARTYLTSALSQFLGLIGTAISIDILRIEHNNTSSGKGREFLWIRVPREDAAGVVGAVSSWVGSTSTSSSGDEGSVAWRVCAKGNFLGAVVHGSGEDVF